MKLSSFCLFTKNLELAPHAEGRLPFSRASWTCWSQRISKWGCGDIVATMSGRVFFSYCQERERKIIQDRNFKISNKMFVRQCLSIAKKPGNHASIIHVNGLNKDSTSLKSIRIWAQRFPQDFKFQRLVVMSKRYLWGSTKEERGWVG